MSTLTTAHTLSQKAPPHTTPSPRTPHHPLTPHPTPPPHPAPFCMTFPSPSGIAVALEALREQRRAAYFYQLCDPSPSPPAAAPSLPPCSAHPVCAAARQHILARDHSEASSCLDAYIHSCAAAGLKPAALALLLSGMSAAAAAPRAAEGAGVVAAAPLLMPPACRRLCAALKMRGRSRRVLQRRACQ